MKRLLLFLFLITAARAQNTAKFPGAVPTTADLGVASNRAETTLATGINASATSIPVASSSGFKAGSFVTIDSEIIAVCSIPDGTHLNVGVSSCPNADGRGIDTANGGGAAASHFASAKVQGRIVAKHVNQAAAEIRALARHSIGTFASVKEYGAVGDDSTDDTAAFNDAATAAGAGGTVFCPEGTYKITGKITLYTGQTLAGPGRGGCTIHNYGNDHAVYAAYAANGSRYITIRDLKITDGNGSRTAGSAIYIDGGNGTSPGTGSIFTIERVYVVGHIDGVHMISSFVAALRDVRSDDALQDGFAMSGGPPTSTMFANTYASGSTRYGYNINAYLNYAVFQGAIADNSGSDAFHFPDNGQGGSNQITLISPSTENAGGHGFYFQNGYGVTLIGPNVSGCGGDAIRLEGAHRTSITGGSLFNCTGYGVHALDESSPNSRTYFDITVQNTLNYANTAGALSDVRGLVVMWDGNQMTTGAGLRVIGPSGNNIIVDNAGTQYSELAIANNTNKKANIIFDNSGNELSINTNQDSPIFLRVNNTTRLQLKTAENRMFGGNGSTLGLDNDGSQYTELFFDHSGTKRANFVLDNTNNEMMISGLDATTTLGLYQNGTRRVRVTATGASVNGTFDAGGGAASKVVCWKADGKTLGYATVAEITAGTCH